MEGKAENVHFQELSVDGIIILKYTYKNKFGGHGFD